MVRRALLLLGLLGLASSASACRLSLEPDRHPLGSYRAIFIGEVTGIRLIDYERFVTTANDSDASDDDAAVLDHVYVTSSTPQFEARVHVLETFRGDASEIETLTLGGCAVPIPALRSEGLFFQLEPGSASVYVPAGSEAFDTWLRAAKRLRDES